MDLRLPNALLALRQWPAGSPEMGECRETAAGGQARLWDEAGTVLTIWLPADGGPARLAGPAHFLVFFRLADGTVRPLQPGADAPSELSLLPGDAVVCLTGSAAAVRDRSGEAFGAHRLAGFIHLHDNFTAPRLAEALLTQLAQHAGSRAPQARVACLVVEAR